MLEGDARDCLARDTREAARWGSTDADFLTKTTTMNVSLSTRKLKQLFKELIYILYELFE